MAYQSLVLLYPLLTTPIISRALGSEVLGIYSYTQGIAFYFSLIALLGIATYGAREIAYRRDSKQGMRDFFWELYTIQVLCSVGTMALYLIYCFTLGGRYLLAAICQGSAIVVSLVDISWFFTGIEEFRTMVIRNTLIKLLSLAAVYAFIRDTSSLYAFILIVNGTNVVGQLCIWPQAIKYLGKPHFAVNHIREHMPYVIKLFIPIMAMNIYVLIDKLVLGNMGSMVAMGYYENSDKLIKMPIGLASAISAVIAPRAAYNVSHGDDEENNEMLLRTVRNVWMLFIPMAFGLAAIAPQLVPWYFGDQFMECIGYIRTMCPIVFFVITSNILRLQFFVPKEMDQEYIKCVAFASVINICINLSTVKALSGYGIILGTLVGEIFGLIYLYAKSNRSLQYKKLAVPFLEYVLSSIVMYIAIVALTSHMGSSFKINVLQMVVGVAVYGACIGVIWIVTKTASRIRRG